MTTACRTRNRALGLLLAALAACSSSSSSPGPTPTPTPPPWKPGDPVTVDVTGYWPVGTVVRDRYSGRSALVSGAGLVMVTPDPAGVVLLERDGASPTPFTWRNATVYYAMTDRFENGDPANDGSYGRVADPAGVGTWHGGDFQGLTGRLDYLRDLGVDALWVSPIVEQVHGFVGGGNGDFQHHAYHGYWALDFTRIDGNWGSEADLQGLVDAAHARGIRVVVDVVLNHPGYATGADLLAYLPEVFQDGTGDAYRAWLATATGNWNAWNGFVNYQSTGWQSWWSPAWIRAGATPQEFPGFDRPGQDQLTRSLTFLPDFKTAAAAAADLPVLFQRKALTADGTGFTALLPGGATVRDHLVKWHADWVARFGVDGFRCDTALNVELDAWKALKDAGVASLAAWKGANPAKKLDDAPFWMVGEAFGHGVLKDGFYTVGGFDALINFEFQQTVRDMFLARTSLVDSAADLEALYARYAAAVSSDPSFGILSYLSSHDTRLFYGDILLYDASRQRQAGTALLLAPGATQIFYGDESGRRLGPAASDAVQGTRSDMNWGSIDPAILAHWKKVGDFRKRHAAVGAGAHQKLPALPGTYAFGRKVAAGGVQDEVVVVLTSPF